MVSVGIRELKASLSKYLDLVRGGETIVITDRGKPIARIETIEQEALPDSVKYLIASGGMRYVGKPRYIPRPVGTLPDDGGKTMVDYVRDQRR
jgi:prevent-host-death family protein